MTRERLSPDATQALDDLRAIVEAEREGSPAEEADRALRVLAALSGLAQENMNRISGWRFMQIGRRIERGILTARMARRLADAQASETTLDALLRVASNPFFPYMIGRIGETVVSPAAGIHAPKPYRPSPRTVGRDSEDNSYGRGPTDPGSEPP